MKTIIDYLEKWSQDIPKKTFIQTETQSFTYQEIQSRVYKFSSILNQFPSKSVISIMFDNSIEFVICYLSVINSGRIVHVISPSISKNNLVSQIKSCNSTIVLTRVKFIDEFKELKNQIKFLDFYELEKQKSIKNENEKSDISSLIYTSGTTSAPKGAKIKHSNVIFTTKNIVDVLNYKNSDVDVLPLSLSHSFGLGCLHVSLYTGATLILHKNSMNILEIFDSIKKNNATTFAAVPATLTTIVNNFPEKFAEKCKGLRLIITNSTRIPKNTVQKILELLPNTKLATYYGLTEASRSTFMIFNDNKGKEESVGKAAPGVEIKIVKDKNKSNNGEIWIKGKNVIESYWNLEFPEKFSNGWIKTGDTGFFDNDGFLYLTGRVDYVINVSGEKVYPEEIENVVKMLDGVDEVIAVGIGHEILGQTIKLLVKTDNTVEIKGSEIMRYCKRNLERFKVPGIIEFVPEFPKNEHGKIIRHLIK